MKQKTDRELLTEIEAWLSFNMAPTKEQVLELKKDLQEHIEKANPVDALISLPEIRKAIANYMASEGCDCCRDNEAHGTNKKAIAELLQIPDDRGYYDFAKFRAT